MGHEFWWDMNCIDSLPHMQILLDFFLGKMVPYMLIKNIEHAIIIILSKEVEESHREQILQDFNQKNRKLEINSIQNLFSHSQVEYSTPIKINEFIVLWELACDKEQTPLASYLPMDSKQLLIHFRYFLLISF